MAGLITSRSSMVPYRSSACESPATEPGTAAASQPRSFAAFSTLGQAKRPREIPVLRRNIESWARIGAQPLKSSATVSSLRARCTSIVPDPAIVDMKGSTTVIANAVATAASIALPPRSRTRAPTRAPSGCSAATIPRRAGGVRFVTIRRDSIMGSGELRRAALGANGVLRDVDDRLVLEVDPPAGRVRPRLGRLVLLDRRPVLARELLDLGHVGDPREGRAEQDQDLVRGLTDRHLADEPEGRDIDGVGRVGILPQILADLLLHRVVPAAPLVEVRLAAIGHHDLHGPDVLGRRALGRPLLLGLKRGAARDDQHEGGDDDSPHVTNHIRADSKTMPRSITREACARSRPVSAGTSGLSASCRSRSISRRIARIRSPSWPPNASSTIALQSSSPDAQRKTAGMNPECTAMGIRRWRARWASCTVSATRMSRSSLRLSLGRFFMNVRASAGSPDRASSISAEQ